jgi:Na+-translocating ferredoxin:NAD+ oxidoreductase subunit G
MKEFMKLVFILFITCGLAAGSLSFINQVTKEPIEAFQKQEKLEALQQVFTAATRFEEKTKDALWDAYKDQDRIGSVMLRTVPGYGGPITLVFGYDLQKKITGLRIITHTETPGLGAKIVKPAFLGQFAGKELAGIALKKDNPQAGAIDAITGATISSRAVTKAVKQALTEVKE